MEIRRLPRVFTVDPGIPFLETVARSLCDGSLADGFSWCGDPLILADATIYVPTRRAARELRSAFLDVTGNETVLLPTVCPLGEFDDDLDLFSGDTKSAFSLPKAIDPLNRQVLLGRLVLEWTKHLQKYMRRRYGDETITTPVSTADAFWLAGDLAQVLDQLHAEDKSFSEIAAATDRDVSDWWQVTLAFLEIIGSEWPAILADRGHIDPAEHRNRALRAEADRLRTTPPAHPVIVAGSTGSIAATAELIKVIAHLPAGAVVLPGLDASMTGVLPMDPVSLAREPSLAGHPQFGLHQLASAIGISPDAVGRLGSGLEGPLHARRHWVSESLKPAQDTGDWRESRETIPPDAFDGVTLLEAPGEAQLAAAIAVSLRQAISTPQATAALVTPDRVLAQRVIIELARHGIEADDSAGTAFSQTSQGKLLQLLLDAVFSPGEPATVLALIKHPLVHLGLSKTQCRQAVTVFEHAILRGGLGRFDPATVRGFVEAKLTDAAEAVHAPAWLSRAGPEAFAVLRDIAARLEEAFAPLAGLQHANADVTIQDCVMATIRSLEAFCADADGNYDHLYDGEAGASLESLLVKLVEAEPDLQFDPGQWPHIIAAISAGRTVRFPSSGHPRVFIWGTLEARLQTVDHMVLGGLNEGTWPQGDRGDPFLTRAQKTGIGMQPPERRIGLSAHDVQMALGQKSVVLARALRADGAPTVTSRWWQRLTTFAGPKTTELLLGRGSTLLAAAEAIDPPLDAEPAPRPAPAPPVPSRPNRFSVTEIDTLRRDPYAIFAKRILGLRPAEPLIRDPDASERGSLIHDILERAVQSGIDYTAADAAQKLAAIGRLVFDEARLPPEIDTIWWSRFQATIEPLIVWERERAADITQSHAELVARGTEVPGTGVTLTGRADRIDRRHDGALDIIDYKTGTTPSRKDIAALRSLQLPLEAALARAGAFEELGRAETANLIYLKLGPRGLVDDSGQSSTMIALGKDQPPIDVAEEAWERTAALLKAYTDPARGYLARAMPAASNFGSDYDHLARTSEWTSGDGDGGDG